MLDTLITSKTRVKLLLKFFLNSNSRSYLRNLETEFGESTNSIRLELNKFEKAGLLQTELDGNKKYFRANTNHPLFNDIHNILLKQIGFDKIIERVLEKLGHLDKAYVTGDFAKGINNEIIDLIFVGDDIDVEYLIRLIDKTEKLIKRKIRYVVFGRDEFMTFAKSQKESDLLILWKNETNK
ncbi:MAG: ArsR family transcriptional regulator [Bacteroidales bacterium]|nr:ArsR family transcriptional regulator [Bacteroidales bacterium]MCF8402520.1 ArsR family transcriptional regulator [Bacteroidales bacterium]